ncbi:SRPBCC family protein [Nocardia sp. XZ_19_385]|uniref:SRPBCC family protein n=1 Tax=Nocardia sp. XZ_19_385 TaxID=2769488 RepID=UPI00188EDA3D|nr:SRPBCC family protein [Nocardia sp. XZ_19_385]
MASGLFYSGPDLGTLHREYAANGRLDDSAQLNSSHGIVIAAPAAKVWQLLVDVANWPNWYPGFQLKTLTEVTPGGTFEWTLGNGVVNSTFAVVTPERELTWSGKAMWLKAVDRHVLEPVDANNTRVTVSESMSGVLIPLIYSTAKIQKVQETRLQALKAAAEKS